MMAAQVAAIPSGTRVAILAINDDAALGALEAFEAAGRLHEVVAVGQNADRVGRAALRRADLPFVGSTSFAPERYGEQLLDLAVRIIDGEPAPPAIFCRHTFITRDNIDDFYPERPTIAPAESRAPSPQAGKEGGAMVASSRERFLQTCQFKPVDKPWFRAYAFVWPETELVWRTQGYEGPELGWHGEGLPQRFGLDELMRVDPWYGPVPEFEYQVIEEDDRTKLYINHEGILMREFKEHADTSMPQFVKFPVETPREFEAFAAERLALNAEPAALARMAGENAVGPAACRSRCGQRHGGRGPVAVAEATDEHPRLCWADRWGGFFGSLRNMLGVQNLCMAFYDQPKLVERMMEERADRIIEITAEVMKYTEIDVFWYWEDMAYKAGPLVGPKMYRKFAVKHYRRVNDWLHSQGIKYIGLDSDGDIGRLIPIWLDSGINMLWPFECQSGMDVVKVREQYGHDLIIVGGIDKRTLVPGGEVMRKEIDRVMPLVEDGGYIPELDHSVPPDISWPNFIEYIEYVDYRLGRG